MLKKLLITFYVTLRCYKTGLSLLETGEESPDSIEQRTT